MNKRDACWPKISIVTPSLNQGRYLEETIESIFNQDYPNLEYIIIDGASHDNSVEIIKKYSRALTYWESIPDNGQAHALNKGFSRVSGDIIGWLNSDDIYLPGAFFAVATEFLKNKIDFLYGGCLIFVEGNRQKDYVRLPHKRSIDYLPALDFIDQPSSFWSRNLMQKIGKLNEKMHYAFDWEFFIRIHQEYPLHLTNAILSGYRIHPEHKTGTGGGKRQDEILDIVTRYATSDWVTAYQDIMTIYKSYHCIYQRLWRLRSSKFGRDAFNLLKPFYLTSYLSHHGDDKYKITTSMLDISLFPPG